jgi:hypothetical protein
LIFGFAENQPLPALNILQRPVIANVVKQSLFFNPTPMILIKKGDIQKNSPFFTT